jgi:uncharacterized protein involved in exopolysaccharide biosynthesis
MTDNVSTNVGKVKFYDVVMVAARRLWAGVICIGIGLIIAGWMAYTTKPVYRAEAVVALSDGGGQAESRLPDQLGGLAALAGVALRGAGDRKSEALATLQSRALTESFVQEKNLLPVLFASRWDSAKNAWKEGVKVPTLWDANKLVSRNVRKVVEDRKTGLIIVAMEWTDPQLAADWTADMIDRTNRLLQVAAHERADRNIAFLKRQLEQTNVVEVRQALNKLMESELKTSMLAQRSEDYVFKVLDRAVVPQDRVRPRRTLILALGIVGGVFGWALFVTMAEMIRHLREEHRRQAVPDR